MRARRTACLKLRRRRIMGQSEQGKASGFFRPRRLGHANLFVSDYERASEFYQSVVGFEEVYRQPDNQASFLSNGNTYHDLGLTDIRSKYAAKDQKPGMWHLAFELETEADLVAGYDSAKDAGVEFAFVMDHDVARSIYKHDPDGNMVEIYADVEKDWRALRHGIIVKEKPKWVPGVTSAPLTEKNYPQNPDLVVVDRAVFHPKKVTPCRAGHGEFRGDVRLLCRHHWLVAACGRPRWRLQRFARQRERRMRDALPQQRSGFAGPASRRIRGVG